MNVVIFLQSKSSCSVVGSQDQGICECSGVFVCVCVCVCGGGVYDCVCVCVHVYVYGVYMYMRVCMHDCIQCH